MSADLLLAFSVAALAVILIPGPTVLLVSSYAFSQGMRAALLCILGVCLGDVAAMALTVLGLGAVLATSAKLFFILKWIGVLYLLYLGLQLWRAPPTGIEAAKLVKYRSPRVVFRAFLVNVLHPKGLAFYVAFLPQFIDPARPMLSQTVTLMAIFSSIAFFVLFSYAIAATRFRSVFANPHARRLFNRTGATCLFGASAYTATLKHNA